MFPTERKRKHIEKLGERNISLEELNTTNFISIDNTFFIISNQQLRHKNTETIYS
jgi:aspartate carbamoyltransferase regulatory subunit